MKSAASARGPDHWCYSHTKRAPRRGCAPRNGLRVKLPAAYDNVKEWAWKNFARVFQRENAPSTEWRQLRNRPKAAQPGRVAQVKPQKGFGDLGDLGSRFTVVFQTAQPPRPAFEE